jgi:hypothetical protein
MAWEYEVHELSEGVSAIVYDGYGQRIADHLTEEQAALIAAAPELLVELKAAVGYMRNAKIDLETGATKATAIRTITGGIARAEEAIAKATPLTEQQRGRVEA